MIVHQAEWASACGFEPSTSVSRKRHSTQTTNMLQPMMTVRLNILCDTALDENTKFRGGRTSMHKQVLNNGCSIKTKMEYLFIN